MRFYIKDSSGEKQRREEEQIESRRKRGDRETFGKSRYNLPNARQTRYCLWRYNQCKRQYKQKRYLMWKIHDLLGIINESKIITNKQYASFPETFQRCLKFRQLYVFLKGHKGIAWNDQIPQSSYLCKLCKNAVLLAKGINSSLRSKLFGNQCTWLSWGKCLRFKSRCLDGRRVWTLLDIKFIVIRFWWRMKTITFLNWQRVDKKLRKSTKVFLLIRLLRKWNSTNISTKSESKWYPIISRSWIWSQERHLFTLTIVKATVTRNRMRYNLPIVVSRALAYLQLALITATVARTIWLKFRWLLSANQMITLESLNLAALSTSSTSWKNWWGRIV